jgi:hypothetical protein
VREALTQTTFARGSCGLSEKNAFADHLAHLRHISWVVDSKRPLAGPEQVLRYLSRYTHRVAISNSRLVDVTDDRVSFTWKDHEARIARLDPPPA